MNNDLLKGKSFFPVLKSKISDKAKEAVGQKIECMDGNFEVHHCCLVNSDILWDFFEGKIQKFIFCVMSSMHDFIIKWPSRMIKPIIHRRLLLGARVV